MPHAVAPHDLHRETAMLRYAILFFVVALVAAVFGFGGIAGDAAWIAQWVVVVFLILSVASMLMGGRRSRA